MEPRARRRGAVGDRGHGVDGGRRGRADRGDDRAGVARGRARPAAARYAASTGVVPHLELEQARRLDRRRVRVLGADDDPPVGSRGPRRRERRDQARRGRVLDVPVERLGQAEQLPQPVERHLLELLQRRRGAPEDADLVEPGDQELGQDPGLGRGRREVGEVARALPVGDARASGSASRSRRTAANGSACLGRRGGQRRPDLARLDLRRAPGSSRMSSR